MKRGQAVARIGGPVLFLLALIPAAVGAWDGMTGNLGANPIEEITHRTGRWGLTFLMVTLSVTPIRLLTGWAVVVQWRRMLGLVAFFYLTLHFSTYVALDQFFSLPGITEDVVKRPYITVGFTSFVLLVPLAITSTNGWVKRLGGRRWLRLHQLVYVAAAGGVFHFLWLVKADTRDPVLYGVVLVSLLGVRAWKNRARRASRRPSGRASRPVPPGG